MQKKLTFNKKLLLIFALVLLIPSVCLGNGISVSASEIDNPSGSRCRVVLTDYRPNSGVMYVGNCGWTGLKGIGAYVQIRRTPGPRPALSTLSPARLRKCRLHPPLFVVRRQCWASITQMC
jgi:hypothetical protein